MNDKYCRYTKSEFIDQGGDATIWKGYDNIKCKYVAMKEYKLIPLVPLTLLRETSILRKISCKYIISLDDVFYYNNSIYLIMELCGENILTLISENKIDSDSKEKITVQLVEAINYLHSIGYIHGDISMKNILYNKDVKMIDFCSSIRIHRNNVIYRPTMYVCPYELLTNKYNIDLPSLDVWMLGCICYFLATNIPLFVSINEEIQNESILNNISTDNNYKPLNLIKNSKDEYIKKMLSINPYKRENLTKIIEVCSPLYKKYDVILSNEKIYMIDIDDKYKTSTCDKYNKLERSVITNKLLKNSNEIETIFVTWKNLLRLGNNYYDFKYIEICYQISHGMIMGSQLELKIEEIFDMYCKLEYDVDPYTSYDYIIYIPKYLRQQFIFLAFLLILEPKFDTINDIYKVIVINMIFKALYNVNISKLEILIKDAIIRLNIDKFYLTKLYLDVLVYMNSYKNESINFNELFNDDIIKWFYNINFNKLISI